MSFVDFMIIGAMKSGTTTLANILSMHPDVCFCNVKEPHFFSKTKDWQCSLGTYKSLYVPTGNQLCGEASTTYTCYPEFNKTVWKSLHEFNPRLKLIYIIRHPIDRIVSHFVHNFLRGYTSNSLEEDVILNPTYLNRTRYFTQIRPYIEYFGREQILLLTFEEFLQEKQAALSQIASFLAIDFNKFCDFMSVHKNKSIGAPKTHFRLDQVRESKWVKSVRPFIPHCLKAPMSEALHRLAAKKLADKPVVPAAFRKILWDLLMLDILEIQKLMHRELAEWNIPQGSLTDLELTDYKPRSYSHGSLCTQMH